MTKVVDGQPSLSGTPSWLSRHTGIAPCPLASPNRRRSGDGEGVARRLRHQPEAHGTVPELATPCAQGIDTLCSFVAATGCRFNEMPGHRLQSQNSIVVDSVAVGFLRVQHPVRIGNKQRDASSAVRAQ
jgi:hypothetical protein